jgi:Phosphoesterase family
VKATLLRPFRSAIAAAAGLTGKRFSLLVASSLVATSAIVASALTGAGGSGALAALLGHALAADKAPARTASAASPAPTPEPGGNGASAPAAGASAPATPAPSQRTSDPAQPKAPAAPSKPDTPREPTAEAGPVKHLFVVSLASPGYEAAFGAVSEMPYLSGELRPRGELLSGYSLISTAGLANSIAAISGQPPNPATEANCPTYAECLLPVETLTLPDQLGGAHMRWRAYVDGMVGESGQPDNCVHPEADPGDQGDTGQYAMSQNPFVYFHSLLDLGECAENDVPLTELDRDLQREKTTPNFVYVAPDPCDAGETGKCPEGAPDGAAAADGFLSQVVPAILESPAYRQDGLLIIAFADSSIASPQVGALLVSPFATPGGTDAKPYTPYSLLRSVEDLFGLPHLAKADGSTVKSFASALLGQNGGIAGKGLARRAPNPPIGSTRPVQLDYERVYE